MATPATTISATANTTRSSAGRAAAPTVLAAYGVAGLVFLGHVFYGANRDVLALAFAMLWFVSLAAALVVFPWARDAASLGPPAPVAGLFGLVVAALCLSLTPYGLGGANPVWRLVPGAPRAVTLDPWSTRLEIVKLLALGAALQIGFVFGCDDRRAKILIRALLALGLAFCAWAFVDHALDPTLLFGEARLSDPRRLSAAFGSDNTAATLFGALALLNVTDLARTFRGLRSMGPFHLSHLQAMAPRLARPLLGAVLATTCLVLTLSRAGIVFGFGGLLLVILGLGPGHAKASAAPVAVLAAMAGLLFLGLAAWSISVNGDALGQRFSLLGADGLGRDRIFAAHWAAFEVAPWSGYGLGAFARVNAMIMNPANRDVLDGMGAAHNVYIQWLEEAGAPIAAAMFALVAVIGGALALGAWRRPGMRSWLLTILLVLALFCVHGASDYALQTPSMAAFLSLLLGVGLGVSRRSGRRHEPHRR